MKRVVLSLCAAEVLTMAGVFAFPALLPGFMAEWNLSATEAGWISGIFFAGYAAAVPVLSALTDRLDARRVWLAGALVAALSCLGFALLAQGFWSAMALRLLGGMGLAGTYMPGLRALVDRTHGPRQPHWMSWYTASFSLGTSLSFLYAGAVAEIWDWKWVYGGAAALAALAILLVAPLRPVIPKLPENPVPLLDFRPVFRNRPVLGYILGYTAHVWELFGLRNWMVAFLAFAASLSGGGWPSPTLAATIASAVAMATSIGGASLAVRFDRRTVCILAALASSVLACGVGFTAALPYGLVVVLVLIHNGLVQVDSAALTTGAMLEADPERRGITIALHSLMGFGAGFVAPLVFGLILDLGGGRDSGLAWGLAFVSLGLASAMGPLALRWSRP